MEVGASERLRLAPSNLYYKQGIQLSAQQVLQESPIVDHMRDIEFSYYTAPIWTFLIILAILLQRRKLSASSSRVFEDSLLRNSTFKWSTHDQDNTTPQPFLN